MANLVVKTLPSNTSVNVQDANNLQVSVAPANQLTVEVTPTPTQVVQINRGVAGPPGPNNIGGFPINVSTPQNYDALMFVSNEWTNIPQTEIADGGNY